jgi:hypothetical protein
MSNKRNRTKHYRERRLRIRGIRRNPPDLKKLAGALIELAQAQAEANAEAEHERREAAQDRRAKHSAESPEGESA